MLARVGGGGPTSDVPPSPTHQLESGLGGGERPPPATVVNAHFALDVENGQSTGRRISGESRTENAARVTRTQSGT